MLNFLAATTVYLSIYFTGVAFGYDWNLIEAMLLGFACGLVIPFLVDMLRGEL